MEPLEGGTVALHEIGRAFDRPHSCIRAVLLPHGGIPPAARRRSRLYFRTHDAGLLWLAVAVVVWPLVSRAIEHRALLHSGSNVQGHPVGFYQFLTTANGQASLGTFVLAFTLLQQFIGAGLLLLAALYLYKARGNATQT